VLRAGVGVGVVSALVWVLLHTRLSMQPGDGTSCYDNCNGHGVCIDYQCKCDSGFFGERCSKCSWWRLFTMH